MKKLLVVSAFASLSLLVACDNQGPRQEEQLPEGEVIESSTQVIERQPAELEAQREVERGSKEVEYTTKRQVTETVKRQQDIPTVQTTQTKANINEMDVQDFRALGFDQQAAERIVQTREQRGGRFNSVDELLQIQGVSQDTFNKIRNDLGVAPRQAQEE